MEEGTLNSTRAMSLYREVLLNCGWILIDLTGVRLPVKAVRSQAPTATWIPCADIPWTQCAAVSTQLLSMSTPLQNCAE